MKNYRLVSLMLVFGLLLYGVAWNTLRVERETFLKANYMDYTLPSKFTRPAALEFKGLVSDFLFLKMITFIGGEIEEKKKFEKKHLEYITESVNTITDLDPYFWDPYLFADMLLTWDFGEFEAANSLLMKAREYRTWDFKPPYYIGFNYFYFMKDNANGARYLREASQLPGSPGYIAQLASRLSVYAYEHRAAIVFLKDMLENTENEQFAKQLVTRIKTLVILDSLEKKVLEYKKSHGAMPKSLDDLVTRRLVERIPDDPYGGRFYLMENGRVYTTSEMRRKK